MEDPKTIWSSAFISESAILKAPKFKTNYIRKEEAPLLQTNKTKKVAISPVSLTINAFVARFSQCISAGGFEIAEFSWNPFRLLKADVAILHWPNDFFEPGRGFNLVRTAAKLKLIKLAKAVKGTKFVWVGHNARPHDAKSSQSHITDSFFESLDGIIYLSHSSKDTIEVLYPKAIGINSLVTVHGHYRNDLKTPITAQTSIDSGKINLAYFGQIRPYKNVDKLAECVAEIADVDIRLSITGLYKEGPLSKRMRELAASNERISLDMRNDDLPDADLELAIDSAHAVVLPYRNILNSGSAILALSRNRPVLAPKIGSLPELQENVGKDWLYLYDGELSSEVITDFVCQLRHRNTSDSVDLSRYDWEDIQKDLCDFICRITSA